MNKFKIGDFVIIKDTIGTTNEVCEIVSEIHHNRIYELSNGSREYSCNLDLWNSKNDLENKYIYGLKFIDSLSTYQKIAEYAYFLWLNGSDDSEQNWLNAEKFILGVDNK